MNTKKEFNALYGSKVKTLKQLKARYRELAKVYHPDVYGTSEMFNKIKDLYDEYKDKLEDYKLIKFTFEDVISDREFAYDNLKIKINANNIRKGIVKYENKKFKFEYVSNREHPMRLVGKHSVFFDDFMYITIEDLKKGTVIYNMGDEKITVEIPLKNSLCRHLLIRPQLWIKLNFEIKI